MTTTTPITEHVLTLTSGHRLRYATRQADGPITVVFVHGWPDSWRSFEPVMNALPSTIGAISVSLRGFGGSDAPPDGYTPDDFAADVHDLAEHLDVTSAVFVGHSMGSLVVQRLAASHPEMVAGLVLIGGLNRLPDDVFADVWSAVEDLADPISEQFVREFQSSTLAAPGARSGSSTSSSPKASRRPPGCGEPPSPASEPCRPPTTPESPHPPSCSGAIRTRSCPAQSKTTCSRPSPTHASSSTAAPATARTGSSPPASPETSKHSSDQTSPTSTPPE